MLDLEDSRISAVAGILAAGIAFSCATDKPPSEPPVVWNQARVTEIAAELAELFADLRVSVQGSPTNLEINQRRARYQVLEDLRVLTSVSKRMSSRLSSGEGLDQTAPLYRRLQSARRSAADNGRRALLGEETLEKVARARVLLDELAPFYAGI